MDRNWSFIFKVFRLVGLCFFLSYLLSLLIAPDSADLFLSTDCKNRGRIEG